jgi:hypothetical protein
VPDHQEVFLDKDGFASIIFDITERPDSVTTDEAALKLHLDDIFGSDDDVKLWYQSTARLLHFPWVNLVFPRPASLFVLTS